MEVRRTRPYTPTLAKGRRKKGAGRPTTKAIVLTGSVTHVEDRIRVKKQEGILKALRVGASRRDAYTYMGVNASTFHVWLASDDFANAVCQAEASAVVNHITRIAHSAAAGNWQASAWFLERKRPDEYGKKTQLDVNMNEMSPDDIKRYIAERLGLLEPERPPAALPEVTIRGELAGGSEEGEEPLPPVSE